jgi:6-phosphofructokinase 1
MGPLLVFGINNGGIGIMERTIGVLTSGGDAPGMNAAIRAVVRSAIKKGFRVLGIRRGYNGLINGDLVEMDMRSVSDILQRGGTVLYTARCVDFAMRKASKGEKNREENGIEGIVVIGGDGSFRGAADLSARGGKMCRTPLNDSKSIQCSEYPLL